MAIRAHTVPRFYLGGFVAPESEGNSDPYVWIGALATGEVKRRSPKNVSISPGLYDGPGGFDDADASIEVHLSKIESAAAPAIRKFAATGMKEDSAVCPEIWRFLAWQAARTPAWMELEQEWANEWNPNTIAPVVEPPPEGFFDIKDRIRSCCLREPNSGEIHEVVGLEEFRAYRQQGWQWILRPADRLESLHLQAWYFQVRHFPRLSWTRLDAPDNEWFITSDRAVAWLVDGCADTPPSALRHPAAQLVAPLTRTTALVGVHGAKPLHVTPREVNRFIAAAASTWIAGPTLAIVEQAIQDRAGAMEL